MVERVRVMAQRVGMKDAEAQQEPRRCEPCPPATNGTDAPPRQELLPASIDLRLGRVDKPDPNANARQQYESGEALNELVVSGGDAT